MTLSLRQWLAILVLIAGFAIAAIVVRGDGNTNQVNLPAIDQTLWCAGAAGLAGTGNLLNGERAEASVADFTALKEAVFDVEVTAPFEIRPGLASLANFTIVFEQLPAGTAWPSSFEAARAQVDTAEVDQAIVAIETEMQLCGHTLDP